MIGIMPKSKGLTCPRCGRRGLLSEAGLNRHMNSNTTCRALLVISACNGRQNMGGTINPEVAVTDPSVGAYDTNNLAVDSDNCMLPHDCRIMA